MGRPYRRKIVDTLMTDLGELSLTSEQLQEMTAEEIKKSIMVANPSVAADPSFVMSPNVDYDSITDAIDKLERLGKEHPMTAQSKVVPKITNDMGHVFNKDSSSQKAVTAHLTGKAAIGPELVKRNHNKFPNQMPIRPVIADLEKEKAVDEADFPPIHEDFLNFLIKKQSLSFGWVVNNTFLANFDIPIDLFKEEERFIFWVTLGDVNTFRLSDPRSFQKNVTKEKKKYPHIFFIKILDVPDNQSMEDPFTSVINDPEYIHLRETLEKRGIEFIYDHNANRLWTFISNRMDIK